MYIVYVVCVWLILCMCSAYMWFVCGVRITCLVCVRCSIYAVCVLHFVCVHVSGVCGMRIVELCAICIHVLYAY